MSAANPRPNPVDILVVDDDPKTLKALEATLAELGQNIVTARSGAEALLRTIDRDFALILLDVQMPELDGFETAALLRSRERSRSIPIIFLTGLNQSDSAVFRGYQVGAVDFLFKPIVPEVLKSKVSVFVELTRKTDEVRRQAELIREAEQREAERRLLIAKQAWEAEALREQMENQRRVAMELEQHNARLALVSETATLLLVATDVRSVIHDVFDRLARHERLDLFLHHLVPAEGRPERDVLFLHTATGASEELLATQQRIPFGTDVAGRAAERRERIVIEDIAASSDGAHAGLRALGLTSYVCFPLLIEGRLIGTLSFGSRSRSRLDEGTLSLIQVVVDQVAMRSDRARLMAALEERDRRKDEFLAMLSHELRNPLSPVMSAVHLLGRHVAHVPAIESTRQLIGRQLTHLVRLVDDLLDVSRITQGKIELQRERVALGDIVDQAVQLAEPNIAARRHTLEVDVHARDTTLVVDATRMAQVAANLLNNAAKYTPVGGQIRIATRASDDANALEIVVSDNGIGLKPEAIARIFDLFVQGDYPADRAHSGLGIGLTLAKRLMELHGGDVIAISDGPNRGSTFTMRIPMASAKVSDAGCALAATGGQAPLRIVVIEDNIDVRDTVVELLRLEGHEVHAAEDALSGIELVSAHAPDVALVDLGLPGRDGYTVARELDELRRTRHLPLRLIAMTGYGRAEDRVRAEEAGFDHHLVKPVDPNILLAALLNARVHDDDRGAKK